MIKVYSTSSCPWCVKAKNYLKAQGFEYQDINVQTDLEGRKEMVEKSHQMGVPVLDIEGKIIIGFDKPAIDAALNL